MPNTLHYVVVEDPLPAGAEALDTSLQTTSKTVEGPQDGGTERRLRSLGLGGGRPPTSSCATRRRCCSQTELEPGSYEFSYQIRASLPGEYLTLPPTAYQMYFPEVWGRGAGSTFTVTE